MTHEQPSQVVFQFFNEIGIINQLASNRLERRLPHGLKLAQFSVLNHFVRLGGQRSPLQLARAFQVTKGAMTNTLKRLEGLGFIEVKPSPDDGRSKQVAISDAGRAAHGDALAAIAPDLRMLEDVLTTDLMSSMLPDLQHIRTYLDEHRS